MLKYEIKQKDIRNIKHFNIVNKEEPTEISDGVRDYYLLECSKPHNLKSDNLINIGTERNVPIFLNKEIKIILTSDKKVHWKYVDEKFNNDGIEALVINEGTSDDDWDWNELGVIDTLTEVEIYDDFILEFNSQEGENDTIYQVKKKYSNIYQNIISESQIELFNQTFNSDKMILKEIIILDNSFKILKEEVKTPFIVNEIYYVKTSGDDICRTYDKTFVSLFFDEDGEFIEDESKYPDLYLRKFTGGLELPSRGDKNWDSDVDLENLFKPDKADEDVDYWNYEYGEEYEEIPEYYDYKVEYELILDKCNPEFIDFKVPSMPDEIKDIYLVDVFLFVEKIMFDNVWVDESNYMITLPMNNMFNSTLHRSDFIQNIFVKDEERKAINDIIDTERIRFIPVKEDGTNKDGVKKYIEIERVRFEFIFLDDDKEYIEDSEWDVLGIKNENIKYQHNKLKKTFVRTLYYDEPNPTTHSLMYYNTMFVNTNKMYKDYLLGNRLNSENPEDGFPIEFEVSDKNKIRNSSNSSEGFFIYLFVSDKPTTEPRELYLKTEFNSAIDGQKFIFFNREVTNNGISLDNIFFEKENERQYIYNKMYYAYSEDLDKYVYFFDKHEEGVTYEDNNTTMVIKLYEAKIK